MRLRQLQEFVAVAECGSVRTAARQLGVTQPALSKSIRQLEAEVESPLFVRSAVGVTVTPFGNAFLPRARLVMAELERVGEDLRALRGGDGGVLRLAVAPSACATLVPRALRELQRMRPRAEVLIVDGLFPSGVSLLRSGSIDLFVGPLHPGEEGRDLRVDQLCTNPISVACRPAHPLATATSLDQLGEARWIFGGPLGLRGNYLLDIFKQRGLPPPQSSVQAESFLALLAILSESDLLSIVPSRMLEHGPFRSMLHVLPLRERLELPPIAAISSAASPPTPVTRDFVKALRRGAT